MTNDALQPPSPKNGSSVALTGLFILALFYSFHFASTFFLPLFLAMFLNLLFSPLVRGLDKLRIPRGLGAGIVVLALAVTTVSLLSLLIEPASEWLSRAPTSLVEIEYKLRQLKKPVEQISRAAEEVEKLTQVGKKAPIEIQEETLVEALFGRARNLSIMTFLVFVLLYFLLVSGDQYVRKLIFSLNTLEDKKRTIEIIRHLKADISYYLLAITLINLCLGLAVGVMLYFLGMPNPILWGFLAAVLNYIPYVGAMLGTVIIALASAFTFELPREILLPPAGYLLLTAIEGYFITPMIIGRRLTLNPLVILLGLFLWGWIWGIAGAILAVPLLVSIKIICEHVPSWSPLREFLGE